ncbi:uncharacterized protein LOC142571048 [Dermacentor variabilis]|uniref:uncharacterized protein LOC142571048 n=1 Tax=Dermacentor variabilis TaxID=34621 RepID=UPI003F5B8D17
MAMKHFVATAFVLGVLAVTAWASTVPEDEPEVSNSLEATSEDTANEAILIGQMLRDVAHDLAQDKSLHDEQEEYSMRSFWTKFKAAMKKAGKKAKTILKAAGKHAKESIKIIAKAAAEVAIKKVKEKLQEKAIAFATKLLGNAIASYAAEDSASEADFVKYFCSRLDQAGRRLIHEGEKLKTL